MNKVDYYEVLEVASTATQDEIKISYRKLVQKYHPDLHKDEPNASSNMAAVNEAYETLGDPNKRNQYDMIGHRSSFSDFGFNNKKYKSNDEDSYEFFRDNYEEFIDSLFGKKKKKEEEEAPKERTWADLYVRVVLTEDEAYYGTKKDITYNRKERCVVCGGDGVSRYRHNSPCSICDGTGFTQEEVNLTVTIPPGVKTGTKVRIKEWGNCGKNYYDDGDLYLLINVEETTYREPISEKIRKVKKEIKDLENAYSKLEKQFSQIFSKSSTYINNENLYQMVDYYVDFKTGKIKDKLNLLKAEVSLLDFYSSEEEVERLLRKTEKTTKEYQETFDLLENKEYSKRAS